MQFFLVWDDACNFVVQRTSRVQYGTPTMPAFDTRLARYAYDL